MSFDTNAGYPAPLKNWWNMVKNGNEAFNYSLKYGYGSGINLPFGRKCFFVSGDYRRNNCARAINPQFSGMGTIMSSGLVGDSTGLGVKKWLDLVNTGYMKTLPLNSDPVICLTVQRIGDLFDNTHNFSELERIAYIGDKRYCYLMGINFYHDWANNVIKFENVHNISEIQDYYVLTSIDVYATTTGALPRTKTNYFPAFVYNYTGTVTAYIFTYGIVGETPIDGIFFIDPQELAYDHARTNLAGAIKSQFRSDILPTSTDTSFVTPHYYLTGNCFNIFAGLKFANDLKTTDINAVMSDGFRYIIPSAYNTKMVFIHKYVEMQDIPSGFMTTAERTGVYYKINSNDDNHVIMTAAGLRNTNSMMVWKSLDDLKQCFEDLTGRPVVFSTTEAINYPSTDIPLDIIPSGFNTNNTPDIISNPDNNTDDFETPDIINPATIACDNYIMSRQSTEQIFQWFTQPTFIDTISKLFNDPLTAIIALRCYPFDIIQHDIEHVLSHSSITIVNVTNPNINAHTFDIGYKTLVSGGNLDYTAYYGNWADWALTKYSVFIPYIGVVDISPSAIVNRHLELTYNVDFITGNAAVILKSFNDDYNKSGYDNGQLVYVGAAHIAVDVPIIYNNYNQQLLYSALSAIKTISATTTGAISGATQGATSGGLQGAIAGGIMGGLGAIGENAINFISDFPRTEYGAKGNIGNCGSMAAQNAYLLIHRRILSIPASGFENISGAPSSYYGLISSSSGFVKITSAKLSEILATNAELTEIATILENGIYI